LSKKERIELSKEQKSAMITAIKGFFYNERDEEMGDLAAILLLDFITESLAPEFYNQGIYDAYKYIGERTEDVLTILI